MVYANQPPVVPVIDKAMRAQLRKVYRIGVSAGKNPAVFAKVGDSITHGDHFLNAIGCSAEELGNHQNLAPTIQFFRATSFPASYTNAWCGKANSFSRETVTADNGWTALEPLTTFPNPVSACPPPDDNPLRCELRLIKPSIALIMLGTNDLEEDDPKKFRKALTLVVQETMVEGVVPVLSTIPPRLDSTIMGRRVAPYNQIIQDIADTLQVPLWNYWFALQAPSMINQGMDNKGIHPNVFNGHDPAFFTSEGLRYGFNQRNFTAVEVLKKLRAVIQNTAPADATTTPGFAIFPTQLQATVQRGTTISLKIKIARINLTDPITLRLKAPPAGISATFVTNATGTSAIMNLLVQSGFTPGNYRITVRGTTGTLKRTTTFALDVTN